MSKPRPTPFTPQRAPSTANTPGPRPRSSLLPRTAIRASTSAEARLRTHHPNPSLTLNTPRPRSVLSTIPGSPQRDGGRAPFRPTTPGSPMRTRSSSPMPPGARGAVSEMDVSVVDPEAALVHCETVEPADADMSGEFDPALFKRMQESGGAEKEGDDKVLVSIRIRPSAQPSAWSLTPASSHAAPTITLLPQHAKSTTAGTTLTSTATTHFTFDHVLTGTPNAPIYTSTAQKHVYSAMDGFNAVIFAYGQTASGKTYTLSGDDDGREPGIIPRAMRDVFRFIRNDARREYLLRCSYLEIYNEAIHDLLAGTGAALGAGQPVQVLGTGDHVYMSPLREEVVTSLRGVREVLERGNAARRTASTDWNERSSRSHSVFRLVVESRERDPSGSPTTTFPPASDGRTTPSMNGRSTPSMNGRSTPGVPPTPGGSRLQARGGRSVRTSVLSLIDLAGSEKATSDKERTREGRYINTSLLTLGTVIGTLAENAAKGKNDHVPFRNSKLTRMLQPSLSGNARISVICTLNPDASAVAESTSTLLFAQRVKRVHLNAQKKEIINTDALIERYRKEIEDLKRRLAEKEAAAEADGTAPNVENDSGAGVGQGSMNGKGGRKRRLSAREQLDESKAMGDLNSRIRQLTKLILTSQSVDENRGDEDGATSAGGGGAGVDGMSSPSKLDFDLEPYQIQQELFAARRQLDSQATQILALEAALLDRPPLPQDAPEGEKDRVIGEMGRTIRELEVVVRGYEENLGAPLRQVREDVEREWEGKVEEERKAREEKEAWAEELARELEKERQARKKLEEERRALQAFVQRFDALNLALATGPSPVKQSIPLPIPGGAQAVFAERRQARAGGGFSPSSKNGGGASSVPFPAESPLKMDLGKYGHGGRSIMLEQMPEEGRWEAERKMEKENVPA